MKTGYKHLAAAVISRAVLDLAEEMEMPKRRKAPKTLRPGQVWTPELPEEYEARVSAWRTGWWKCDAALFLTAEHGEWARSRKHWCESADISSSALRERCANLITKARAGALRQVQSQLRGQVRQ